MKTDDNLPGDDPLDPALRDAAQSYHEPPLAVPREAMWGEIQARRRDGPQLVVERPGSDRIRGPLSRRPWLLSAAAVVLLATGIALGWSAGARIASLHGKGAVPTGSLARGAAAVPGEGVAYRIAVARELTQVEALLTAYQTTPTAARQSGDRQLASWARDLLVNTRLLLDSPAGVDQQRRRLLEDLELVLVQMVELAPDSTGTDREMIDQTLDRNHVLTRLRAAVPAGGTGIRETRLCASLHSLACCWRWHPSDRPDEAPLM